MPPWAFPHVSQAAKDDEQVFFVFRTNAKAGASTFVTAPLVQSTSDRAFSTFAR